MLHALGPNPMLGRGAAWHKSYFRREPRGLRNRTPDPPPFSSINSIPARSKTARIASIASADTCALRGPPPFFVNELDAGLSQSTADRQVVNSVSSSFSSTRFGWWPRSKYPRSQGPALAGPPLTYVPAVMCPLRCRRVASAQGRQGRIS